MEEAFGKLPEGERDKRDVLLNAKVLTARRLGSVLFLSVDNVLSFTLFPPKVEEVDRVAGGGEEESSKENTPPTTDIFEEFRDKPGGEKIEVSQHSVLQVILTKEDFKGEIQNNSNGEIGLNESLKELSRTIAMGHTVDIFGKEERTQQGQLRVCCEWLKITMRDRATPSHKFMSKQDRDFQGHVPLCHFFRRGQECKNPACTYRHEFKDERERLNSINMQMRHQKILQLEKDPCDPHPTESKKHRHKRAEVFVEWLQEHFKDLLSPTTNFLDIAGGRGTVSLLLLNKGFNCVLVEPREHKFNQKKMNKLNITIKGNFSHLQCRLDDDFVNSDEGKRVIEEANIVIAMHPDEATEAMVDLSLRNNKPFAVVPCCVFPNLFPRKNKQGEAVITYFQFISYLLEKDPDIKVGYLGFQGRTKVLYKL